MIGIFDSGEGGLSVYREIFKLLPAEKYIYYSDNAHCPYGNKSADYIKDRTREISSYLIAQGCEVIVVACNTATAAAIETLRSSFKVPFVGMEPAVKPAAAATRCGVIGVLATACTLKTSKYLCTKEKFSEGIKVVEKEGTGLVELVESGCLEGPAAEAIVFKNVKPIIDEGADVIVLGCTHYPFLRSTIQKIAGEDVLLIDPAPAAAKHLLALMQERALIHRDGKSNAIVPQSADIRLCASGDDSALKRIFALL